MLTIAVIGLALLAAAIVGVVVEVVRDRPRAIRFDPLYNSRHPGLPR